MYFRKKFFFLLKVKKHKKRIKKLNCTRFKSKLDSEFFSQVYQPKLLSKLLLYFQQKPFSAYISPQFSLCTLICRKALSTFFFNFYLKYLLCTILKSLKTILCKKKGFHLYQRFILEFFYLKKDFSFELNIVFHQKFIEKNL